MFKSLILALLPLSLAACATSQVASTQQSHNDIVAEVLRGEARLDCGSSCSGSWGSNRRQAVRLLDEERWDELIVLVAGIGFRSDYGWYLLGRAAEAKGQRDIAEKYYRISISPSMYRCNGLFNNCDRFEFPRSSNERLLALSAAVPIPSVSGPAATQAATSPGIVSRMEGSLAQKVDASSAPDSSLAPSSALQARAGDSAVIVAVPSEGSNHIHAEQQRSANFIEWRSDYSGSEKAEFVFRGNRLGDLIDVVRRREGELRGCKPIESPRLLWCDVVDKNGDARWLDKLTGTCCSSVQYRFLDGKFSGFQILTSDQLGAYSALLNMLRARYGSPTKSTQEPVTTQAGRTVPNSVFTWSFPGGTLWAEERYLSLRSSVIMMTSNELSEFEAALSNNRANDAAKRAF